jgi:hypothetical protein
MLRRRRLILLSVAVAVVSSLSYIGLVSGPKARASVEQRVAKEVEAENKQFCASLGVAAGTDAYSRCARLLQAVRENQMERDAADSMGML